MKSMLIKKGLWLAATLIAEYVLLKLLQKQESDKAVDPTKKKTNAQDTAARRRKSRLSKAHSQSAHH